MPSHFNPLCHEHSFLFDVGFLRKIICKALQAIQIRIIVMCVFISFSMSACLIIIGTAHVKEEDCVESTLS